MRRILLSAATALMITAAGLCGTSASAADFDFDVVVYGATPGGVMAAIEAQREGLRAAVVEPTDHIGGMVTGGLSLSDVSLRSNLIGGLGREFFGRVGAVYHKVDGWNFEPKVGAAVLNEMLTESGATVFLNDPLREASAVTMAGPTLLSFTTKNSHTFTAAAFIDAGYEGDLMARSGVSSTFGREASTKYGESLAGVRGLSGDFTPSLAARDATGALYPQISSAAVGPVGSADTTVQAYGFRFEVTQVPTNRVPFPRPTGYRPADYALLAAWLPVLQAKLGRELRATDVLKISAIPNGKFDVNSNGSFSTDFVGGNVGFVEGTDASRDAIRQRTRDYDQGLMYFLANDPAVPAALRTDVSSYGLPADEFTASDNFPTQLYVREARRMIGSVVLTQADVQSAITKPDSVGMAAYRIDTHMQQRVVDKKGNVRNEGSISGTTQSYQLPYRMMVPQESQATNLLVVGAVSASHVAFASLRMEPQFMMLGQAAGVAARIAITDRTTMQGLSTSKLTDELTRRGAILTATSPIEVIVDAGDAGQVSTRGDWTPSTSVTGYYGSDYLHSDNTTPGSVSFRPNLPANGTYKVYARWTAAANRTSAARYTVTTAAGRQTTVTANQQLDGGTWVLLGSFSLTSGHGATVTLSTEGTTGKVVADAVRFVR